MMQKYYTEPQIITKLCQADIELDKGATILTV